ncbi:ras-related protein Rab-24-like [Watersipora subatra]|uniref:ras-related protein Rab-24-like n=1 Tax=Watersipora subatra TaxID=2589382 RepID=UPI00355C5616
MAGSKVDMKTVLLGKEYTGKTCLVQRYLHSKYNDNANYQATVGAAFAAKRMVINGKSLVMGIWDTAGSERYEAMSRIYYRGAKAAIVCYDLTDRSSFDRVRFWVQELRKNEMDCRIYLCATKKDLVDDGSAKRQVDIHDATDYADEFHAHLFETSSKTGENIDKLFYKIAEDFLSSKSQLPLASSGIHIDEAEAPRKSRCRAC